MTTPAAPVDDVTAIRALRTLPECRVFYDSGAFQARLQRLYATLTRHGGGAAEMAHDWALAKAAQPAAAQWVTDMEADRKTCLALVYALYDAGTPTAEHAAAIDKTFGKHRVSNILGVCLALDRANALYHMTLPGAAKPGMHWYAAAHAPQHEAELRGYTGFATINKRLPWLVDSLQLGGGALSDWLEPVFV